MEKNIWNTERVILKGSERKSIKGAKLVTDAQKQPDPNEYVEVTLSVRRKSEIPTGMLHTGLMTHEQLEADHGAIPADLAAIRKFAKDYSLRVIEEKPGLLTVKLAGKLQNMEHAFGVKMHHVKIGEKIYRHRTGSISLPKELDQVVEGVMGLANTPQARTRFKIAPRTATAYTPMQVAELYQFPEGDGTGQIIAIIELGGGFTDADLTTYFADMQVSKPVVTAVPVSGGTNQPTGDSSDADGEVLLDIEVAGAIAPHAQIKVYFAPNTDKGFLDAINEAIGDPTPPTVISISWGSAESEWTPQTMLAFEKAFQNAAALSIPVAVASGDSGSTDETTSLNVDFPASAPHALGCGGTHLEGSTSITSEVVWNAGGNATGGGVSSYFTKPSYQANAGTPKAPTSNGGRGVPDVCGNASVETGYITLVNGEETVSGGTSAVAPLWAGLIARLAQNLGHRVPFLNPVLYSHPTVLRDITSGSNHVGSGSGPYNAGKGWDACTGLGSPVGTSILHVLGGSVTGISSKHTSSHTANTKHTKSTGSKHTPSHGGGGHGGGHNGGTSGTSGSTGSTGSTGITGTTSATGTSGTTANIDWDKFLNLPPAVSSNPVLTETPPATLPQNLVAGMSNGSIDSQSIVALVALASNVANTAITAITAIANKNKKD